MQRKSEKLTNYLWIPFWFIYCIGKEDGSICKWSLEGNMQVLSLHQVCSGLEFLLSSLVVSILTWISLNLSFSLITWSCYIVQAGLKLTIFLSLSATKIRGMCYQAHLISVLNGETSSHIIVTENYSPVSGLQCYISLIAWGCWSCAKNCLQTLMCL